MAYSRVKVDFTDPEHEAAEALDEIYEALADGLDLQEDLAKIFSPTVRLYQHLSAAGSLEEFGDMFIDLGVMLKRDNEWLTPEAPAEDVPE